MGWKRHSSFAALLKFTQREMSKLLGTRQQTVSEWETGMYKPRGASARLLSIVAERAKFDYDTVPLTKRLEKP